MPRHRQKYLDFDVLWLQLKNGIIHSALRLLFLNCFSLFLNQTLMLAICQVLNLHPITVERFLNAKTLPILYEFNALLLKLKNSITRRAQLRLAFSKNSFRILKIKLWASLILFTFDAAFMGVILQDTKASPIIHGFQLLWLKLCNRTVRSFTPTFFGN